MICASCQSPNTDTARFCRDCGQPLIRTRPAGAHPPRDPAAEARDQAEALIGCTIDGKYRVEAPLGAGGMGMVYRATRLQIGDAVAIKTLQPELVANTHILERFRREAQAAARLKHPNVVTIHDFGCTREGLVYLVMELVDGQSLRALLNQHGPFLPAAAAEIITQVCAALDEAHQHQIIHRDLKPDNIIVTPTTRGPRVKVLDFGIARWRDLSAGMGKLTQTGAVLGTPHYMSPEQCLGQEIDGRADIYSLGIMLYEMLSGAVPFNSLTLGALITQHVHQPPPPLRSINPSIPPAVETVVMRALEKRPEARPQTAGALAQQFNDALRSGPVLTPTMIGWGTAQPLPPNQPPIAAPAPGPLPMPTPGTEARERRAVSHLSIPIHQPTPPPPVSKGQIIKAALIYTVLLLALTGGVVALVKWRQASQEPVSGVASPGTLPSSPTPAAAARPETHFTPQATSAPVVLESETKKAEPTVSPLPSVPANVAELTVRSSPPECSVWLDGQPQGNTNQDGFLNLAGLKSGRYSLIARKPGFRDEERTISLTAGQNNSINISLNPLPGSLSISPNVAGARIEVSGLGGYTGQVNRVSVAPGRYQVTVSKPGYRTVAREIEVKPAEQMNLPIGLEPIPAEESLGLLNQEFRKGNFDRVIDGCKNILSSQPNQPQANLLLGQSYYNTGRHAESVDPLVKAIKLGQPVNIPIQHHKGFRGSDALCRGDITLHNGIIKFSSSCGGDFRVPFNKLRELKPEPYKGGRLHIEVMVPKQGKESQESYNFHVLRATVVKNAQGVTELQCNNCNQEVEALYELLRQLRQ